MLERGTKHNTGINTLQANTYYKKHGGYTALHLAAPPDQAGETRMLHANGGDLNYTKNEGRTPQIIAASKGNTNVL